MKNIVVVEDNQVIVNKYKSLFSKELPNVSVEYYLNANDALERVTQNKFDLLLVKYNLKDEKINGIDIARMSYALGKPIFMITKHKIVPRFIIFFKYFDMFSNVTFINKPAQNKSLVDRISIALTKPQKSLSTMFHKITNL